MSPSELPDLQFDRADFEGSGPGVLSCHACAQPIVDTYYDINTNATCPACHERLLQDHAHRPGLRGVIAAIGGGLAAGVVGALLYYAVAALTGYEIGLIAIVVGLLVGHAVRWGSGGVGGRRFQVIAVAITYVAIVSTYVPFLFQAVSRNESPAVAVATAPSAETSSAPAPGAGQEPVPAQTAAGEGTSPPTGSRTLLALGMFALLVLALPLLGGFENVLGMLIIGFALWEAWKANRRQPFDVRGPFARGDAAAIAPPVPS